MIPALPGLGNPNSACQGCQLDTSGQLFGRIYSWKPEFPSSAPLLIEPDPGFPQDGSADWFCGGHSWAADGSLVLAGGNDWKSQCANGNPCGVNNFGHAESWRLDTSYAVFERPPPSASSPWDFLAFMAFPRWYPTLTAMNDASVWIAGHISQPVLGQDEVREVIHPLAPVPAFASAPNLVWNAACDAMASVAVHDYPRLHLLACRLLLWSAAYAGPPYSVAPSRFVDVGAQPSWPSCPGAQPGEHEPRWRELSVNGQPVQPSAARINGSSLHYVLWDEAALEFKDVVYAIGGAEVAIGGDAGQCSSPAAQDKTLASVEKIVVDSTGQTTGWTMAQSMNFPRVNHCSVILLDGSILAVGGKAIENGDCVYWMNPERWKPEEVFGTSVNNGWAIFPPHARIRQYHSCAVLLPDGRVVSGGGRNTGTHADPTSAHNLEIYSPMYAFSIQPRPQIHGATLFPPEAPAPHPSEYAHSYNQEIEFTVTSGTSIERVALIRNGSSTHAFDMDQRYVQLRVTDVLQDPVSPRKWTVRVLMPVDGYQAPPGYYMLTVVDENRLPSPAEWIRLGDGGP